MSVSEPTKIHGDFRYFEGGLLLDASTEMAVLQLVW